MRKDIKKENYLERIPVHPSRFSFTEEDKKVTFHIENKGFFKRLTQLLIKKPKVSHIHLDELGSFIWLQIDGERSLAEIGKILEREFGDKAKPTYERLSKFFYMLESYKFIDWKSKDE